MPGVDIASRAGPALGGSAFRIARAKRQNRGAGARSGKARVVQGPRGEGDAEQAR
jgi:hypothetical protein